MSHSLEYLKGKEWSLGNGQCPECLGVHEGWHGHLCYMNKESIGHVKDCALAKAIKELGGDVLYVGEYKSDKQFEHYIDNNGIFGTRLKTENGCAEYKKFIQKIDDILCKDITNKFIERYNTFLQKHKD